MQIPNFYSATLTSCGKEENPSPASVPSREQLKKTQLLNFNKTLRKKSLQDLQCFPLNEDKEPGREKGSALLRLELIPYLFYFGLSRLWEQLHLGFDVEGMSLILKATGFSHQGTMQFPFEHSLYFLRYPGLATHL